MLCDCYKQRGKSHFLKNSLTPEAAQINTFMVYSCGYVMNARNIYLSLIEILQPGWLFIFFA